MIRRTLIALAVGALLGVTVSMIWGPGMVAWWGTPPFPNVQACSEGIHWATQRLVQVELGLAAALAFVMAIIVNAIAMSRKKPQQTTQPAR
jgi:membrane protein implicated in regulation of membrane protease activity